MIDLRFMIINSNLHHSQVLINQLKNRVSFEVYQDTQEQDIWGLMQGGKDDLYVYDRCGRLAYYIPFPLSIMSSEESSLVTSAILATYYRSPCGNTCGKNSSTLEDFLNKVSTTEAATETTTEEMSTTTELYPTTISTNMSEANDDLFQGNSSSSEISDIKRNSSEVFNDFDYPTYDDTLEDYGNNETDTHVDNSYFNSLYRFFFNTATTPPPVTESISENLALNSSSFEPSEIINDIQTPLNMSESNVEKNSNNSTEIPIQVEIQTPKPKKDRCAEADQSVCKDWSKKRLMRAHTCCTQYHSINQPQFCKNFGKKRCKKMRTILKCCIKTALFEATTEAATKEVSTDFVPETEETETTVEAVSATETESTVEAVSTQETSSETASTVAAVSLQEAISDITCCKDLDSGKLCRVTQTPACEPDEYVQEVPLLGRTM